MTIYLRQSTASQEVPLGYFLDSTDGNTEETALTIANTDIKLWKTGATTLANKNSGGATHISNGIYYAVLDATDTNTLGSLVIFVHVSGALAVKVECLVLTAVNYDALVAGTDNFQTDLTQIAGVAVSTSTAQLGVNVVNAGAVAWNSGSITSSTIATDAIDADALAADAVTEIANSLQTVIRSNTAQGGASNTITLDASASATDDFYKGDSIYITTGTGALQPRLITGYVGSTKVATVSPDWTTAPDNTSVFQIFPGIASNLAMVKGTVVTGVGSEADPWGP
jgi:hypothetical protein